MGGRGLAGGAEGLGVDLTGGGLAVATAGGGGRSFLKIIGRSR